MINFSGIYSQLTELFLIDVVIRKVEFALSFIESNINEEIPEDFFLKDKIVKATIYDIHSTFVLIWWIEKKARFENIVSKVYKMFPNLQLLCLKYNRFGNREFQTMIDIMRMMPFDVDAVFSVKQKSRHLFIKIKDGVLLFKHKSWISVIKAEMISFTIGTKWKIYDSDENIFSFSKWIRMKIKRAKVLSENHSQVKSIISFINKDKNWHYVDIYYAVLNRNFKTIKLDNFFQTLLPKPVNSKRIEIVFQNKWNKWQIQKYIKYLQSVDNNTMISFRTLHENNNIEKLSKTFLELSVQEMIFDCSPKALKISSKKETYK